jgi:outer membrane protein, multidrug efflux system
MTRRRYSSLATLVAAIVSGCVAGPAYVPETVVTAKQAIGVTRAGDSSRVFFDSLATARRADTARVAAVPSVRRLAVNDSMASVAWLELLHDTTLVRLVNVALDQNRDLRVAEARIREFRAAVGVAKSPLAPSLALNGSESTNQVVIGSFPPTAYRAARLTADLTWELDFWGRLRRGVQAASADLGAQEASERAAVLSLVGDVATSYLQLLELDQERSIAERTLSSRQTTLDVARARYSEGLTSELDVKQFEAQVAAPAVTLAQSERATAVTEHNLNVLLGEGPTQIPRRGSLAAAVDALSVPDSIPAGLLARRPDLTQAERNYAAATARIGVADAARLPTISIVGSLGTQAGLPSNAFADNTHVYQAFVGFSFPVFDYGRLSNVSAEARARADQARASYESTALNALREANDALAGVRAARDEAVAQATQARALREALNLAESRYQAGLSSYLDLLDAQRSLFSAELALSQAQLGELTAAVQLYKALGGTWGAGGTAPR